ncbi:MAG TPA: hypothetical protein VMT28_05240 [Terriglobales bacterium]|nr:hypothetical protein [Terriglobales bacterium]
MNLRNALLVAAALLLLATAAVAGTAQEKQASGGTVDSGSFGIFVNGRRVATETFSVHAQAGGANTIASELKEDGGGAAQSSELQITSAGVLVRYEWHELAPGKGQLEVTPKNDFLVERITANPGDKPAEQPFLMPNTSVVLDNNFLIQREVLAWRYLASSCTTEKGQMRCAPAQFGAIVPQDRTSTRLSVQPVGEEKITVHGVERPLLRLNLKSEDEEWALWLDPQDHYKLIRVTRSGDNSEVVRD